MVHCGIDTKHPNFRRAAKAAVARQRSLPDDLEKVLEQIKEDPYSGGDRIKCNSASTHVRKKRIGCEKERVSERGGYRLIFQVIALENTCVVRLLHLYYKPSKRTFRRVR